MNDSSVLKEVRRIREALDNISAELELLRKLKESELD